MAFVTFYIDVSIHFAGMLEGGGKVTTRMCKLWSNITNVATILKVVDKLIHEYLVKVKSKFCL